MRAGFGSHLDPPGRSKPPSLFPPRACDLSLLTSHVSRFPHPSAFPLARFRLYFAGMNVFRLLLGLCFLAGVALADETYDLRMARPVKAGAKFKLAARVAFQSETKSDFVGLPDEVEKVNVACKVTGELTVVNVTGKGMAKEIRLKLEEVESYRNGEPAKLFSVGDVITMKHHPEKDEIHVNGEEPDAEAAELLDALLNVCAEEEATDDEVFGAKGKVKVGDEWTANREALAVEMKRQNLDGLKADDFKATTKVAEKTTVNGEPAVRVICEMKFDSPNASLPNVGETMKTKRVSAEVKSEMDLPLDTASHAIHARWLIQFQFDAAGNIQDEEGKDLGAKVSVKRRAAVDATEVPIP